MYNGGEIEDDFKSEYHEYCQKRGWLSLTLGVHCCDPSLSRKQISEISLKHEKLTIEQIGFDCLNKIGDRTSVQTISDCMQKELRIIRSIAHTVEFNVVVNEIQKLYEEGILSKEFYDLIDSDEYCDQRNNGTFKFCDEFEMLLRTVDKNTRIFLKRILMGENFDDPVPYNFFDYEKVWHLREFEKSLNQNTITAIRSNWRKAVGSTVDCRTYDGQPYRNMVLVTV